MRISRESRRCCITPLNSGVWPASSTTAITLSVRATCFRAAAPSDEFGTSSGTQYGSEDGQNSPAIAVPRPACYNPYSGFGAQTGAWNALLNNGQARQIGMDIFGHYHIPDTAFTLFGMFQWFLPNDKVRSGPARFPALYCWSELSV